ncbi:MAG: arginine--tRNA ligase [Myxococcota bacterium]
MRLEPHLDGLAARALREAAGAPDDAPALLRPTQDPSFGDYQINGAMALAKRLGRKPRELAGPVAEALAREDAIASAEIAGPGFINLRLDDDWLAARMTEDLRQVERVGVPPVPSPEKVVVDFSSPNIAKQMHVGHLRSTIIGDAICRLLRFAGHEVVGDNHIGDWGTQFGLLIVGMREWGSDEALEREPIVELERVYKLASERAKQDGGFAERARQELSKLQAGDPENRALWERFVGETRKTLDEIYGRLGVRFDEWLGESAYEHMLPAVIQLLLHRGVAREDQGAICIFWNELPGAPKELAKQKEPFIVRKRDGAFLYSTTDIATLLYRRDHFRADRSVYVVDTRQSLHFRQLFAVARMLDVDMRLDHVGFGTVLGPDGRPLRTRDTHGNVITLKSLLDEAEQRAAALMHEEGMDRGDLDVESVARAVGIGAVKYADLRQNRTSDYKFEWDKMISFKGNAGPYMQYAHARVRSIFRRGAVDAGDVHGGASIILGEAAERDLARRLVRFADVVHDAAETYQPHLVCDHLYALARAFSVFFESCPVLRAEPTTRDSRLGLAALTAAQLKKGLELLGIEALDRM